MAKILIVDDEEAQRRIVSAILREEGHLVREAESAEAAKDALAQSGAEVVITDLKMPGQGGMALVEFLMGLPEHPEAVVVTAFGTVDTAVKAMRLGAYNYLSKPLEREELILVVQRAAEKFRLRQERTTLRKSLELSLSDGLVAESQAMKTILEMVPKVAASTSTILIRGETGTGKERIARLIHHLSPRRHRPLQAVNCAAFPESLFESELFGYEKGAFTGAQTRKIGILESADGSSLFLDEIGDMAPSTQTKLLRVLQEREIRRVGGTQSIPVDLRLIAATNLDLEKAVREGKFREELYYRLNVIPILIPPLRERREDIPALIRHFLLRDGRKLQLPPPALEALLLHHWPGNVRELEAVLERICVLATGPEIQINDLPPEIGSPRKFEINSAEPHIPDQGLVFEDWEKSLLLQALERTQGNMTDAARLLGMTYRTFQYRMGKFGLKTE